MSAAKQRQLREHFVAGTTARTAAYYHRLRELIYQVIADATLFAGEIEVDESYFASGAKANVAWARRAKCRCLPG